jgi:hypothetical protein
MGKKKNNAFLKTLENHRQSSLYNEEAPGMKFDSDKPRTDLLPPKTMLEVSRVLGFGADKYDAENWRKVEEHQDRYTAAALRHIFSHMEGKTFDSESGLSTLAHAICCLSFILEIELEDTLHPAEHWGSFFND